MPGERISLHGHSTLRDMFVQVKNTQPGKLERATAQVRQSIHLRGGLDISGRDKNGFVGAASSPPSVLKAVLQQTVCLLFLLI